MGSVESLKGGKTGRIEAGRIETGSVESLKGGKTGRIEAGRKEN